MHSSYLPLIFQAMDGSSLGHRAADGAAAEVSADSELSLGKLALSLELLEIFEIYWDGSIPIDTIFSGLFTSIYPSYFDVNYRGTIGFDPSPYIEIMYVDQLWSTRFGWTHRQRLGVSTMAMPLPLLRLRSADRGNMINKDGWNGVSDFQINPLETL